MAGDRGAGRALLGAWRSTRATGVRRVLLGALLTVCVLGLLASAAFGAFVLAGFLVTLAQEGRRASLLQAAAGGALLLTLGAAAVAVADRRARERRRHFEDWAAAHGWHYRPSSSRVDAQLSVPGWGSGPARDVLDGSVDGLAVTSFTRQGQLSAGRADGLHHLVMTTLPVTFPVLRLDRETAADRAEVAAGGADIRFESEAFNRTWRVRSSSPEFAHAVLHPRLMERLLRPDIHDVGIHIEDRAVVVHRPGPTDLGRVRAMADLVAEVAAALPRFVERDAATRFAALPPTRAARRRAVAALTRRGRRT